MVLHYIRVNILQDEECKQGYDSYNPFTQLCVRTKAGQGICTGDSGGALVIVHKNEKKVVGIASFIQVDDTGSCVNDYLTIFTRVQSYSQWVSGIIGENS